MPKDTSNLTCAIIGASHAGVNLAFSLRREGWEGEILLFDSDPEFPYHRPPLSKTYLTTLEGIEYDVLFPKENYSSDNITLKLGTTITEINREEKTISFADGNSEHYDKLVLATGARPLIPVIEGLNGATNVFTMRTAKDTQEIRKALNQCNEKRVVIIGGGYIGLETAASLRKIGAEVIVLEREERILSRVTSFEMSMFFNELHKQHNVALLTNKNVIAIESSNGMNKVICDDDTSYQAAIIILGVGVKVNTELAAQAGLEISNGIKVNSAAKTNDNDIYAIGDCTYHFNQHYQRFIRLESVQNAVDQAKVAAAAICGKEANYDAIPWFWSDQYDVKLQMVGLSQGYTEVVKRVEINKDRSESVWYFRGDELLAVDAVNNGKAYVLGTRFIRSKQRINKQKLADTTIPIKPTSFL